VAVTPAYQFDVPSPNDTYFTNGEKAVSVSAAPGGAAARTNYFLSTWADLEGGEYILRVFAVQASSWATSVSKNNPRVFFSTARDAAPQEATVSLPRGRQRIDILLSNVLATAGSCYVAFSLWRQGRMVYKSEAAPWVFDTVPLADAALLAPPNPKTLLPVFAVQPNWANPIIERLQYATEVLSSEADVEQRRSLRTTPRRSFEMSFSRHSEIRSRIDTFLGGIGRNKCMLPIWHEQYVLTATLTDTLSIADGTIAMREFRDGGFVIVMDRNPAVYEVLQISTANLTTGLITFTAAPAGSWPAGSRVMPLREARVSETGTLNNITDAAATASIRFEIEDSESAWFTPSWGNCSPVWGFTFDRGQQISVAHDRVTAYVVNDEYGPVDVYDLDQKTRLNLRGAITLIGRAATFGFRQFIDMARGRAVRFWMPSFTSDVQAVSTIGGTTLTIKSVGYADYMKTDQDYRGKVVVEYRDGNSPSYADVESVQRVNATTEQITLATGLPSALASQIARISFMMPVRFDQDLFELQHLVDGGAAVKTSVVTRTADVDGMLPIECAVTSKLYPIEMIDGITPSFAITGGFTIKPWFEGIDSSMSITGGSVTTIVFHSTEMRDEAVDASMLITGGTIVPVVFHSTEMRDEAVDASLIITGGAVSRTLIQQTQPAEAVDASMVITGGAIT
jgi:phage baseplate assembly protein gpV